MASAVLELAVGTAPSTPSSGLLDLFATATKQLATVDDAGNVLQAPVIREAETLAVQPKYVNANTAAPTGNVSTAEKMMGLAVALTPQVTGRVLVLIAGMALNSTAAGDGTTVTGRFGTGAAPANGAAVTGTIVGLPQHFVASTTAGQQGFLCMGVITGLTLNVPIWIDLGVLAVTAGGSTVKDVQVIAMEF